MSNSFGIGVQFQVEFAVGGAAWPRILDEPEYAALLLDYCRSVARRFIRASVLLDTASTDETLAEGWPTAAGSG